MTGRGGWDRDNKRGVVGNYLALEAHRVLSQTVDPHRYGGYELSWNRGGKRIASLGLEPLPGEGVWLMYSYAGQPQGRHLVRWETTQPHYGGLRYWWLCPGCGRRCAALYAGRRFLCRRCMGLTYASAQRGGGDIEGAIDRRLVRIRHKLGGKTEMGWATEDLPDKPKGMHVNTYFRLCVEYARLQRLREAAFLASALRLPGMAAELGIGAGEAEQDLKLSWQAYRRDPTTPRHVLDYYLQAAEEQPEADPKPKPKRYTLGELAELAGVPYAFAQEAQREGLIRPDAGRTTRRRRYRGRLARWLGKLQALRSAGLSWEDTRAWAARRWLPGNEAERRWPAGYNGPGAPG